MSCVLIVEDEALERDFLKSIVQEQLLPEDTLLVCTSGTEAVQLAKQHRPNIIIMDIVIPEMDGIATIAEIRKFLPNACISILSAYSDFSYAQKAISFRVFEYLLKPVKPTVFKETFAKMLKAAAQSEISGHDGLNEELPESKEKRKYYIEEAVKYIKEHFKEKLTLEKVASQVYLNPKYFSHIFKKEMGISFVEYVMQLRIQHACYLLENTNYQAYRISLECGFSDPSYFNRVFCAHMKMTPQTYRKRMCAAKQKD